MEMVDDVIRLLDHLNIAKAHVVGYSMGGVITHKLAIRYPDRLLSATVGGIGWLRAGDPDSKEFIDQLAQSLDEGKGIAPLLTRLSPVSKPQPTAEELRLINSVILSMNDAKALAAVVRGFHDLAVSEKELMSNTVPMLVLIGSLDPAKTGVDQMKEKLPNLKVVEIPGTDHMTAFKSSEFNKALKEFLAQHKQP
jgi:pimeloyl-ACP methyl ester carboxylesterase